MLKVIFFSMLFCYSTLTFAQTVAYAGVSATLQPAEDMVYLESKTGDWIILPAGQKEGKTIAPTERGGGVNQVIISSFNVSPGNHHLVSVAAEEVVLKRISGPETFRFTAIRWTLNEARNTANKGNTIVSADVKSSGKISPGIYAAARPVEITVYFD